MDLGLNGKTALVTGAGRGIGAAIAQKLAAEGARVVLAEKTNLDGANDVAQAITRQGGEAVALAADVGDPESVRQLFSAAVSRFGTVDILVNNAGIVTRQPIVDTSPEDWDRVIRTNLYGGYHCVREAVPLMRSAGGGKIVNISSIHGRIAKAAVGAYGATKSGIDMLTKQLAVELAPDRINVNAVAPGTIVTEINIPLYKSMEPHDVALRTNLLRRIPAQRIGEPADIANAVAFLASSAADYISGAILYVDGGYTADGTARP